MWKWMVFLVVLGTFPSLSEAAITVRVVPGIAPDLVYAPLTTRDSWMQSVRDYHTAVALGQTPNVPADFVPNAFKPVTSTVSPWYLIETNQSGNSGTTFWNGQFNPTGVYANQYGSAVNFTASAFGTGELFMAKYLAMSRDSNDPGNRWDFVLNNQVLNYGVYMVGVLYGADGKLGGGDDTYVTSGSNTQLVNGVILAGAGTLVYSQDYSGATRNEQVNNAYNDLLSISPFGVTTQYMLKDATGNILASAQAAAAVGVPEPSVLALFGLGSLGLLRRQRRK